MSFLCIRDPTKSLFEQFIHYPLLTRCENVLTSYEHSFPNGLPGLREIFFALDHQQMWSHPAIETCCRPVWNLLENECKWNIDVFCQNYIVGLLRNKVPFESLVCIAHLIPMLLLEKTECFVLGCVCREDTYTCDPKTRAIVVATDFDGTYGSPVAPSPPFEPTMCFSERVWKEFKKDIKAVVQRMPVYIRGTGIPGDLRAGAIFKADMIRRFNVTHFLENDESQIEIIQRLCPDVTICKTL